MKAVILAGGFGTRISEETQVIPKPMIQIGGKPILWHIMKTYSHHGVNDFIICLGYKGYVIKEYFANYFLHTSDVTFDMRTNGMQIHQNSAEPWRVTLVDTGENTATGGRLLRVKNYIGNETFCFTYGDGVSNVNLTEQMNFHRKKGKLATVTTVRPPGRYGAIDFNDDSIVGFREKPEGEESWINGGYFILEPTIFDYIHGDQTAWEGKPLESLAENGELSGYMHYDFWHPMDTLRDKLKLEELWNRGNAPWKVWEV